MATSAVYTLQRMAERDRELSGEDEPAEGSFQTGRRTNWDFTLQLQRMDDGVTLEVVVESSPTDDEEDWEQIVTFGSQTDTSSDPIKKADETVDVGEQYIRARHTTLTGGKAIWQVQATSPFFDPSSANDQNLLSQSLRELNTDDRARLAERAEQMVLDVAIGRGALGKLEADLTEPDALERVKRAIARQAEHLHQRDKLTTSREASALKSLREWSEMADDVREILGPILPHDGARVLRSLR